MKIFLLGYMGSGKTTVAKKLASKLGFKSVDLDKHIEDHYKTTIPEIFKNEGEEKFRLIEHNCLKEIIAQPGDAVVALGGGTPCYYENMDLIVKNGITVYLKISVDGIMSRLKKAKTPRPLIEGKTDEELRAYIEENLEKRESFYLQAQYKVKAKNIDIDELAGFIQANEVKA